MCQIISVQRSTSITQRQLTDNGSGRLPVTSDTQEAKTSCSHFRLLCCPSQELSIEEKYDGWYLPKTLGMTWNRMYFCLSSFEAEGIEILSIWMNGHSVRSLESGPWFHRQETSSWLPLPPCSYFSEIDVYSNLQHRLHFIEALAW